MIEKNILHDKHTVENITMFIYLKFCFKRIKVDSLPYHHYHYLYHHHNEFWKVRHNPCFLTLKVKLVPQSFPRLSYISALYFSKYILPGLVNIFITLQDTSYNLEVFIYISCCVSYVHYTTQYNAFSLCTFTSWTHFFKKRT